MRGSERLGLVLKGSFGLECSSLWRSGLAQARMHLCRSLLQSQ
jgi:hypothetical protein